jgi:hypothetical protein
MSSNTAGVFTILLESTLLGVATRIASEDVRMEDLLQARYEKRPFLSLFNGKAKVNFERFLYQINKKYATPSPQVFLRAHDMKGSMCNNLTTIHAILRPATDISPTSNELSILTMYP